MMIVYFNIVNIILKYPAGLIASFYNEILKG